MVEGRLKNAFL